MFKHCVANSLQPSGHHMYHQFNIQQFERSHPVVYWFYIFILLYTFQSTQLYFDLKRHRQAKLRTTKFFAMWLWAFGILDGSNVCCDSYHVYNVTEIYIYIYIYIYTHTHTHTIKLTLKNSTFCPHSVFMCFVWFSEQTAIISLYNINWLFFITETEGVYCAVGTGSLYVIRFNLSLLSARRVHLCVLCGSENKQRLFPYTALTDWFLWRRRRVFTVQ